jgi:hypothetical protein
MITVKAKNGRATTTIVLPIAGKLAVTIAAMTVETTMKRNIAATG